MTISNSLIRSFGILRDDVEVAEKDARLETLISALHMLGVSAG